MRLLLKGIKVLSPSNITPVQHFLGSSVVLAYLHGVPIIQGGVALYPISTCLKESSDYILNAWFKDIVD